MRRPTFESSVILEGTKTSNLILSIGSPFESSVILEGTKTIAEVKSSSYSLRVV